MSGQIRTFNITIGKVYNNGVECKNPKVELEKRKDIAVNCIDPSCGLYQIQISPKDLEPCLTFLVTCDDCDICGTKVIEKCLCDSIDDCEKCEICNVEGFCESTCTDICEDDGTCVECNVDHPCPCNQDCQNGKCTCPAGSTLNANGCCDECQNDGDCDTCSVCILVNGGKTCQAKDCNCDLNGKCGTPGECVECTQSGHCPENERCNSHCECECTPGYTRINGICTPTECPNGDEDCPPCFICSGLNCVPNQCPSGKVPVVIDGECACVQECNCEQPNCSSEFNFCGESAIEGKCGCIPCKGNCTDGCEDPCICDEDLDKCKFNPCFGSCENGSDCGPTCGCLNGECVPCEILDCATQECGTALGCACSNTNNCEKDDHCNDAPCSVASDCADGCTCDQGTCKSCSNFACPNDCAQHDGCACSTSNKCEGDDSPCDDTLIIEKDDANCDIIGTLTKDNCCQCSPLTLDVIPPTSVTTSGSDKKVTFKAELRKGTFDGISVYSNPRLDANHPSIAENEKPLTGSVSMSYTVTSSLYTLTGTYLGDTTSAAVNTQSSFLGNAEATFASITLPSIGKETISGNQKSVVKSIKITFTQSNVYTFPNDCAYREGKVIGIYNINKNEDFSSLLPIGTTITSSDCRKPLFKWTKSSDSTFDETPFRKKYIDPKTVGVYEDTVNASGGAESCFNYNLESDCTCDDPTSKYVVFCNPDINGFPEPVLTDCNTKAQIEIAATCDSNFNKYYRLEINGVLFERFYLNNPYSKFVDYGQLITSIVLRLECDTTNECTITHTFDSTPAEVEYTSECTEDSAPKYTFVNTDNLLDRVEVFSGNTLIHTLIFSSGFSFEGEVGETYTYIAYLKNKCVSDEATITPQECCLFDIEAVCENNQVKVEAPDGSILKLGTTIGNAVIVVSPFNSPTEDKKLFITYGNCDREILIPANLCACSIPVTVEANSAGNRIVVTISNNESYNVKVNNVTQLSNVSYGTHIYPPSLTLANGSYNVVVEKSNDSSCFISKVITIGTCNSTGTLTKGACELTASITNPTACSCISPIFNAQILSVVDAGGNKLNVSFKVNINGTFTGLGAGNAILANSKVKVISGTEVKELTITQSMLGLSFVTDNIIVDKELISTSPNVYADTANIAFSIPTSTKLEFTDGCSYSSNPTIGVASLNGSINPPSLTLISSTVRNIEYVWYEDTTFKKREYKAVSTPSKYLKSEIINPNKQYNVDAICNCSKPLSSNACFDVANSDVSQVLISNCGTTISLAIASCYINLSNIQVSINGSSFVAGYSTGFDGTLVVSGFTIPQLYTQQFSVVVKYTSSCVKTYTVNNPGLSITPVYNCINNNTQYEIMFNYTNLVGSTPLIDGTTSGTIALNKITGVNTGVSGTATITFDLGMYSGCDYLIPFTHTCPIIVPSSSPSSSPSPSSSISSSPSASAPPPSFVWDLKLCNGENASLQVEAPSNIFSGGEVIKHTSSGICYVVYALAVGIFSTFTDFDEHESCQACLGGCGCGYDDGTYCICTDINGACGSFGNCSFDGMGGCACN